MDTDVNLGTPRDGIGVLIDALLNRDFTEGARRLVCQTFKDGVGAWRALLRIVSDAQVAFKVEPILDELLEALKESPDPDLALVNFERLCDAIGKLRLIQWLNDNRATIHALIKLLGTSNYAADTLCLHPEYLSMLFPVSQLQTPKGFEALAREAMLTISAFREVRRKWESLRRFRRKESLRIIAADILGMMRCEDVLSELTALAEAVVRAGLDIALQQVGASIPQQECGFLVIALGKLGGVELNYSSDIDLMFTYDRDSILSWALGSSHSKGDEEHLRRVAGFTAEKLAQTLVSGLSEVTDYGRAYRVDLRLRPYGRSGPIVLEWGAMMSYYESWARAWERMALIKARPIAGDVRLALRFGRFCESYVYMAPFEHDAFAALLEIKRHSETMAHSHGDVKIGRGGIRDIEFAIQLLQLTLGNKFDSLKTTNTLRAIDELHKLSLLTDEEANSLRESYIFLRTLEHMLQIVEHLPMRELPELPDELEKVARRMGYAAEEKDSFIADYKMHTERVRSIYERIVSELDGIVRRAFEDTKLVELTLDDERELEKHLLSCGFANPKDAMRVLRLLLEGPAEVKLSARERMAVLRSLPTVLKIASQTVNPDAAIQRLEQLSTAIGNRAAFISSLCSNEAALQMLLRCISLSEFLTELMMRYPEHLEVVLRESSDSSIEAEAFRHQLCERTMSARNDEEAKRLLRRFKHREILRIGFMELNGILDTIDASFALATTADTVINAALHRSLGASITPLTPFNHSLQIAVLGLGGLGAQELHYASDLDLSFVHESGWSGAEEVIVRLIKLISDNTEDGVAYKIDVRLRPLGGASLSHPEEGWHAALKRLEAWHLLSLPRMRHIAGSWARSNRLIEMAWERMHDRFSAEGMLEEVLTLWQTMQREHTPPKDVIDPKHVSGGLLDLQVAATLMQLAYAHEHHQLRHHSHAKAIETAARLKLIGEEDANALLRAHRFLRAVKALITLAKSPQVRSISINDASFPHLAAHLTGKRSPSEAASQLLDEWERITSASHSAILRITERMAKTIGG